MLTVPAPKDDFYYIAVKYDTSIRITELEEFTKSDSDQHVHLTDEKYFRIQLLKNGSMELLRLLFQCKYYVKIRKYYYKVNKYYFK